ncbi:hypothetical protein CJ030_MR6G025251 [Morella rubra]|uniref:Uncharacterized protein n=1 Tax=Morella rubra TaxID=262757 RepID=A0A6A1VDK0_9ROSI|nr:hypothetical protein CJ030_MR6G025251 [Morella rubra]
MKYHGSSISDILDDQGWIRCLKREDVASVDLVWEFYVTLLEVTDIDAQVWSITIRGVTFLLSANILSAFLGLQRPIGAYPAVEMENKPDAEDIFLTFMGWDMVVVGPFVTKLCVDLETHLTSMESQMVELQPFLTTTLGTLRVMSRRLGAIEDQIGKMSEFPRDGSTKPGPEHD